MICELYSRKHLKGQIKTYIVPMGIKNPQTYRMGGVPNASKLDLVGTKQEFTSKSGCKKTFMKNIMFLPQVYICTSCNIRPCTNKCLL